jgi:hypothetical protein
MTAIFDADRKHRYRLEREVQPEGIVASIIMVNGSDAGETENDHTVTKLVGFGKALGWRRFIVGNLFARVGKDIKVLREHGNPVGPHNDVHLAEIIAAGDVLVVGWGALAKLPETLRKRWIDIVRMADGFDKKLYCLGVNDDGHPKHPLMIGYDAPLVEWQAPWFPNRGKR